MTRSHPETIATLILDEQGLCRLAQVLALKVRPGATLALWGDLGAGKSTFARAMIRASLGDPDAEVPSPTFAIEQTYDAPRGTIAHYDLYRVTDAAELVEIGFDQRCGEDVVIVEWPDRAGDDLPAMRIDLHLTEAREGTERQVIISASEPFVTLTRRAVVIAQFLGAVADWRTANIRYLQGDASQRSYARLERPDGATAVLMDAPRQPDGPPVRNGMPYSRIAHLAEDVTSFVRIGETLQAAGLSVPELISADEPRGLLLLSDLGDRPFGVELDRGGDQAEMWRAALQVLVHLRRRFPSTDVGRPGEGARPLPRLTQTALEIEVDLLLDWYWPHHVKVPLTTDIRASYRAVWQPIFNRIQQRPPGWFLRDYHSPNLMWRPERDGIARVGVIDFQDALAEHWAYDVASLLQDARRDVPAPLEAQLLSEYGTAVRVFDSTFDDRGFREAYADFGAQRNTRLIGLWVRLLKRDGKPNYLQHMPRTWDYLERNLAHPNLADLKAWFDRHIPVAVRKRPIEQ